MRAIVAACTLLLGAGAIVRAEEPTPTPISGRLIQPIVQVKYIGAAPAGVPPEYIDLIVEEDGGLSSLSHSPPRCQRVPQSQVKSLTQLLNEVRMREALSSALPRAPFPRLVIIRNYTAFSFSAQAAPEPIRRLVAAVDAAFAEAHCRVQVPAIAPRLGQ